MAKRKSGNGAALAVAHEGPKVELVEELIDVEVEDLYAGPWQYRKRFDEASLAELARSISRLGLQQRPTVRPRRDRGFDIIAGERRVRASKLAGRVTVPVRSVRLADGSDVGDELALELAVSENSQRTDPDPLEECDGFVAMRTRYGRTAEQIAATVEKSVRYVLERLALEDLHEPARVAMLDGKFGLGVAVVIARVKNEKHQASVVKDLTIAFDHEGPVTIAHARSHVRGKYLLKLADAPFDVTDSTLNAEAGACGSCPKRSGNQKELFDEVTDKDVMCGDGRCWDDKKKVHAHKALAAAKEAGQTVLTAKEAKGLFSSWNGDRVEHHKDWIALGQNDPYLTDRKTWKSVLGRDRLGELETAVVVAPSGAVIEVARKADVLEAVKAAPKASDPSALKEVVTVRKAEPKRPIVSDHDIERATETKARSIMIASIEGGAHSGVDFWRAMALSAAIAVDPYGDSDALSELLHRRNVVVGEDKDFAETEEALLRFAADASLSQLGALLADALTYGESGSNAKLRPFALLMKVTGVDLKHCRREAAKELRAAAKAKTKTTKKTGDADPSVDEDGGDAADDEDD